ncbi:MAG: NAD(P)-dependent oxidoreductase [Bacteriovoracaceae bacterium]|nr:NAD(P)-dependent oxidoreductase [Bacteriovoracaceae bacterium]
MKETQHLKILVTGSNGFIGQHLLKFLFQKRHHVFTLARKDPGINRDKHFALGPSSIGANNTEYIKEVLLEIRPDLIFHLATSVHTNGLHESMEINCQYAMRIIDAIKLSQLQEKSKLIVFGSAAEYGFVEESSLPIKESHCPRPISNYGISKLSQTQMSLSAFPQIQVLCIRPFTVLGHGMPHYMAIGSFVNQIKKWRLENPSKDFFLEVGNLETLRDFIDIDDAIPLIWSLAIHEKSYGNIVNLCSGVPVSLKDMVHFLVEHSGMKLAIRKDTGRMRSNDLYINYGDPTLLKSLTGFQHFLPWQQSLNRMLQS